MGRVLVHEPIAMGMFNENFCGASSFNMAWQTELTNTGEALMLLVQRMLSDYTSQHPKMRRPFTVKEIEPWAYLDFNVNFDCPFQLLGFLAKDPLQKACCAYQSCLTVLKASYPTEFLKSELDTIHRS